MTIKYAVAMDRGIDLDPHTLFRDIVKARANAIAFGYNKSRNILIYEIEYDPSTSFLFAFKAQCVGHVMTHADGSQPQWIAADPRTKKYGTYLLNYDGKLGRRL